MREGYGEVRGGKEEAAGIGGRCCIPQEPREILSPEYTQPLPLLISPLPNQPNPLVLEPTILILLLLSISYLSPQLSIRFYIISPSFTEIQVTLHTVTHLSLHIHEYSLTIILVTKYIHLYIHMLTLICFSHFSLLLPSLLR